MFSIQLFIEVNTCLIDKSMVLIDNNRNEDDQTAEDTIDRLQVYLRAELQSQGDNEEPAINQQSNVPQVIPATTYQHQYKRRNKLQRQSITCPSLVMALCGVHIGMMIYNDVRLESWTVELFGSSISLIIGIFYVSAIFGMWLGSFMIGKIAMETLYVSSNNKYVDEKLN